LQRTIGSGLKLDAQKPIEMKFFGSEPLFQFFASRSVKFDEHFPFLHVEDDAARGHGFSAEQTPGKFFGALARQTGQRVLRNITRHLISGSIGLLGRNRKEREYMAGAEKANPPHERFDQTRRNAQAN
jgi:hypothetical protein